MSVRPGAMLHRLRLGSDVPTAACNSKFVLDPKTLTDTGQVCWNCQTKRNFLRGDGRHSAHDNGVNAR